MSGGSPDQLAREDELREEFWEVAGDGLWLRPGDDLGTVSTTSVARALTGIVRLLASTEARVAELEAQAEAGQQPEPMLAHYVVKDEGDGALAYWSFDTAEQAHSHPYARDPDAVVIAIPSAAAAVPPPADQEEA